MGFSQVVLVQDQPNEDFLSRHVAYSDQAQPFALLARLCLWSFA